MPCYTQAEIRLTENWKVRADLFAASLKGFVVEMESIYGKSVQVKVDQTTAVIMVYGERITVDMKAGTVEFKRNMDTVKNALKRHYSQTVVKHVAQNPRIRAAFDMKQKSTNEFVLNRRR